MEKHNEEEFKVEDLISKIDNYIKELDNQVSEIKSEEEKESYNLEQLKTYLSSKEVDKCVIHLSSLAQKALNDNDLFFKISELFKGRSYMYSPIMQEVNKLTDNSTFLLNFGTHENVLNEFYKEQLTSCKNTKKLVLLLQKNDIQVQYDKLQSDIEKSNGVLDSMLADSLEDYKNELTNIDEELKIIETIINSEK